ncbi:MAG: aspartate ammonia-lyase [Fibrobacter sp.]|nr:aspartate ammonia-lyase [Fibrobacter sp.]
MRTEHDLLGTREIPDDVYWGIHTLRALENFTVSSQPVNMRIIRAVAVVKKACAQANAELLFLDSKLTRAIEISCDEIVATKLDSSFPLRALQGGAGTSTNMNVNEVIANRSLELLGYQKSDYSQCHPIEHVNLHQSTNDVYPTAVKIASIEAVRELSHAAELLQDALQRKEKEFSGVLTIGRTELQDAVPVTIGAEFSSFAEAIARDRWRTFKCEERLRVVNIGGTAVGTGLTAPRSYIFLVIEKLRQLTGYGLTRGENMMDQTANADACVEVSGILSAFATNIMKICNDLRMLHFTGEIKLPPVQAGSSIMPGKVNPVIMEAAISASIKVNANHQIVTQCAGAGSLQINEFLPLLAHALIESMEILQTVTAMLASHVDKIEVNALLCEQYAHRSVTLITAFLPIVGYEKAEKIVKEYEGVKDMNFIQFLELKLGSDLVKQVVTPAGLMALGFK